ncbi:MAG: aminotransferase class III-fold pyridoxal phosphate-dependent enzyme, partial [Ginsengibacter sp.]
KKMDVFTHNPVLGHINTFGGHPVSCAAGHAAMLVLMDEKIIDSVFEKEKLFLNALHSPKIKSIKSKGLMIALEFESFEYNKKVIDALIQMPGAVTSPEKTNDVAVFTDWFLFAPECMRIAPPLTISPEEITMVCAIINKTLDKI